MNAILGCSTETITPGIVQFDPAGFVALFPSFAVVPPAALTNNFNFATLLLNNSCCSVVCDAPTRSSLLNLATAHITALLNGVNGQPPSGIVGRINSATQGTVSLSAEYAAELSASEAYWAQTAWGAQFLASTAVYRTARYVPACDYFGGPNSWDAWPQ